MTFKPLPKLVFEVQDPTADPKPLINFGWAVITGTDPLRIRNDGETDELPMTPESLVDPTWLAAGDRVWVQSYGLRRVILGRSNVGVQAGASYVSQAQAGFRISGLRTVTSSGIAWGLHGIVISSGKGVGTAANGYFFVDMPPSGTVIPVLGSNVATSVTVSGGVIPLSGWRSLYYALPLGGDITSLDDAYVIVDYTDTEAPIEVPSWWVLVAKGNASGWPDIIWGDGMQSSYMRPVLMSNGWVNYGPPFAGAGYKVENGRVYLEGLVKNGSTASGTIMGQLPSGCWPKTQKVFALVTGAAGIACRIDVTTSGLIVGQSNVSATLTSLDQITFGAEQ